MQKNPYLMKRSSAMAFEEFRHWAQLEQLVLGGKSQSASKMRMDAADALNKAGKLEEAKADKEQAAA